MANKTDAQKYKRHKSQDEFDEESGDDDQEISNKDIMKLLRTMQQEGSDRSTNIEKKLDSVDTKVTNFGVAFEKLQETVVKQDKKIQELENKISQLAARNIHTNNNILQEKNAARLANLILTGLPISDTSSEEEVSAAVSKFMSLVEVPKYQVVNCAIIPWGQARAVKCTFSPPSIAGDIIRSSHKLIKGEAKTFKYGVVPDLSREQRAIKKKLLQFGKTLADRHGVEYKIKSWRYLVVKCKNGAILFYETDSAPDPPVRIDPQNIPVLTLPPGKHFFRSSNSESPVIVNAQNPKKSQPTGSAGSQHPKTAIFNKERPTTHRKSLVSNNLSQTSVLSQSSVLSQLTGTPQSQPIGLSDLFSLGSE